MCMAVKRNASKMNIHIMLNVTKNGFPRYSRLVEIFIDHCSIWQLEGKKEGWFTSCSHR